MRNLFPKAANALKVASIKNTPPLKAPIRTFFTMPSKSCNEGSHIGGFNITWLTGVATYLLLNTENYENKKIDKIIQTLGPLRLVLPMVAAINTAALHTVAPIPAWTCTATVFALAAGKSSYETYLREQRIAQYREEDRNLGCSTGL